MAPSQAPIRLWHFSNPAHLQLLTVTFCTVTSHPLAFSSPLGLFWWTLCLCDTLAAAGDNDDLDGDADALDGDLKVSLYSMPGSGEWKLSQHCGQQSCIEMQTARQHFQPLGSNG